MPASQELVGDGLGNFHVDFSMDGAVTEFYGIESLMLGKETYDKHSNTSNDNNTDLESWGLGPRPPLPAAELLESMM